MKKPSFRRIKTPKKSYQAKLIKETNKRMSKNSGVPVKQVTGSNFK